MNWGPRSICGMLNALIISNSLVHILWCGEDILYFQRASQILSGRHTVHGGQCVNYEVCVNMHVKHARSKICWPLPLLSSDPRATIVSLSWKILGLIHHLSSFLTSAYNRQRSHWENNSNFKVSPGGWKNYCNPVVDTAIAPNCWDQSVNQSINYMQLC